MSKVNRHLLRTAATEALWNKRSMMPEHSEEIVDDVLDVVLPIVGNLLDVAKGAIPSSYSVLHRELGEALIEMGIPWNPNEVDSPHLKGLL